MDRACAYLMIMGIKYFTTLLINLRKRMCEIVQLEYQFSFQSELTEFLEIVQKLSKTRQFDIP